MNINKVYHDLLKKIMTEGKEANPRNCWTHELLGHLTTIDMCSPVVTTPDRRLNYRFMAAEAHWILSGSRHLNHHEQIDKKLRKYSDNHSTLTGAYGPPFIEQVPYVVHTLNQDYHSRQAVITFWKPSPRISKDIPCTVAMQFLIRDQIMHSFVDMRSSDAFLGWPYDMFSFSMMSATVALSLQIPIKLGKLTVFVGSQHIYEENQETVNNILNQPICANNLTIDILRFNTPDFLLNTLGAIMNTQETNVLSIIKEKLCPE